MCGINEILRKSFYKLKIKHQVLLGIMVIILINLFLITLLISLGVFLLSNSAYKDIINMLDNLEFDQMSHFSIAAENANMNLNEIFRSYAFSIGLFKKNLKNKDKLGVLSPQILKILFPNFVTHIDDYNPDKENKKSGTMVYFSPTRNANELKNDKEFQEELTIIYNLSPVFRFSHDVNVLPNIKKYTEGSYFEKIIFVNFKFQVIFYYPTDIQTINKNINLDELKDYVKTKNIEMRKFIEDINSYEVQIDREMMNYTIINLPYFTEKDIFKNFFTPNTVDLNILTSYNIFPNSIDININNYLDNFQETIFIATQKNSSQAIYDLLTYKIPATTILVTEFQYPYILYTPFECSLLNFLNNFSLETNKKTIILEDCFDTSPRKENSDVPYPDFSDKNDFFQSLQYFDNTTYFPVTSSTQKLIREKEKSQFSNFIGAHKQSKSKRVKIYGNNYKVKKSISPLSTFELFKYHYPSTHLYSFTILKNEGPFRNNKKYVFMKSISNFLMSFAGSLVIWYTILVFVIFHLIRVMSIIDKPLNIINDAVQSISEKDKLNDAKFKLEKYIYDTHNDEVIDEFVDLITIILDMIEGNMNLKQEITMTQFYKLKMEEDKLNKEFELVKFNNLLILEENIMKNVEKKNYFNDILKISIEKEILEDEKVKRCETFLKFFDKNKTSHKRSRMNQIRFNTIKENQIAVKLTFLKFPFNKADKIEQRSIFRNDALIKPLIFNSEKSQKNEEQQNSSSEEEHFDEDENIFDMDYAVSYRMKKEIIIKDQYILSKLRKVDNNFYYFYANLQEEVYKQFSNRLGEMNE